MRVTVIGAGYVGLTSTLALAHVGHDVVCVETEPSRLVKLKRREDPLGEPGLGALLSVERVSFVVRDSHLKEAEVIIVAVGTPALPNGHPDTSQIDDAARSISSHASAGAAVLVRSTVPVGTCDRLQAGSLRRQFVISNPEFLREGRAVQDTFAPDRIVAGGPEAARPTVVALYSGILDRRNAPSGIVSAPAEVPFLWMTARSAELTKYAANAFLATKLSFANEIANLAALAGADAHAVLGAVGLDPRIGRGHLSPSLGWGGGCLPKDTRALQALAAEHSYDFRVLSAAIEQNEHQITAFAHAIAGEAGAGGRIGLLGLTFKAGTVDTRESPALGLARRLVALRLSVVAYDPMLSEPPSGAPEMTLCADAFSACTDADVVAVATEWPVFSTLDLVRLRGVMRGDALFDGRGVIDRDRAESAGFRYWGVGLAPTPGMPVPVGLGAAESRG